MRAAKIFTTGNDSSSDVAHYVVADSADESFVAKTIASGFERGYLILTQVNPDEPSDRHRVIINMTLVRAMIILELVELEE